VKRSQDRPATPIYVKTEDEMVWPDDTFFYLLTADGLFACRNHKLFRSCVVARRWPPQLARQEPFLKVAYPKMSRRMIERIVGFFSVVADLHGSEAGVLLAWDEPAERLHVVVPDQVATVNRNRWGDVFPIGLEYETPTDLPSGWVILGDVHSHVDYWPTPSYVDDRDETHRAGVHMVVGRIHSEPPEFHVEAVVDGKRFILRSHQIMEGYRRRDTDIPQAWLDKLRIKTYGSYYRDEDKSGGNGDEDNKGACSATKRRWHDDDDADDDAVARLPEPDQYPDADAKATHEDERDDRA